MFIFSLLNQVQHKYPIFASKTFNFKVDAFNEFELGGKNKKNQQITALKNAYLVKDNIEIGTDKTF